MSALTSERFGLSDPDQGDGHGTLQSEPIRPTEIHKTKPENVWLHDPDEESRHSLSAGFNVPLAGRALRFADLIEVQRQIGILQAHRQLGVPEGEVFTLDRISLTLLTHASSSEVARDQGSIRAQIVANTARGRARSLTQHFALEGTFGLIAVGRARASLIPRAVYERVREQTRALGPLDALSPRPGFKYEQSLRVDAADPVLSDHPSDHLTAMQTIVDVERAAHRVAPRADLRSLKLTFQRYAESEPRPTLRLNVSGTGRLAAEVVQLGVRRATVTGLLAPNAGHR